MAIGDLKSEKVYDFASNINPPLQSLGNTYTYNWDSASGSLQTFGPTGTAGALKFTDALGTGSSDCELTADIKLVSDAFARRHFGFFLLQTGVSVLTGYRFAVLDATMEISRWINGSATIIKTATLPAAVNLNQSYNLKVTKSASSFKVRLDGVLVAEVDDATYPDLCPALFMFGCTTQTKIMAWRHIIAFVDEPIFKVSPITAIPANQEPRSQFQPQDVAWRGSPGSVYAGPVLAQELTPFQLIKGRDFFWQRDGVQNVLQGYIESTVTIDGEGVARRVLCFTQDGDLVAETTSRASDGKYRFDLLWLNRRYMLVAQDDPAFGPADYNAVAADFQLPKPYAPGEGIGLTGA